MSGADGRANVRLNGVGISDSWHVVYLFLSIFFQNGAFLSSGNSSSAI